MWQLRVQEGGFCISQTPVEGVLGRYWVRNNVARGRSRLDEKRSEEGQTAREWPRAAQHKNGSFAKRL